MDHQALITIAPWTLIVQICNLLLQAWLFKKFLFKPIKKIIDQRKAEIDGLYEEADKAKQTAQEAESTYTQKLLEANTEASAIISQAAQTAQEKGNAIVTAARQEAAALKERAAEDIRLERKKAVNEMKNEISGIAVAIATKVTEKEIGEDEHTALIEKFISELGEET